jgi:hypothetical protein
MMEVSKVLLYCTKKKPYLFENYTDKVTWDKVFARKFGEWNRFMLIGAKPDYIGSGNYYLNGFVCFECDCKEAFKYTLYAYHFENVKPINPMRRKESRYEKVQRLP